MRVSFFYCCNLVDINKINICLIRVYQTGLAPQFMLSPENKNGQSFMNNGLVSSKGQNPWRRSFRSKKKTSSNNSSTYSSCTSTTPSIAKKKKIRNTMSI